MNKMARATLGLYSYDPEPDDTSLENMMRQGMELIARFPMLLAYAYQAKRHFYDKRSLHIHYPHDGHSTAESILRVVRSDKLFTQEEAKLLDMCLVLHAEHGGGNNSAFACRVVSSSGTDTYGAIASALSSLKGPLHGGANIQVMDMFEDIKGPREKLARRGRGGRLSAQNPPGRGGRRFRQDLRHGPSGLHRQRSPRHHSQAKRPQAGPGKGLRRGIRAGGAGGKADARGVL
jgi:citrate synthase